MSNRITASARVQLVVEFTASAWGDDCKLDQVFEQASREVTQRVTTLIREHHGRVIGEPTIIAVLVENKP